MAVLLYHNDLTIEVFDDTAFTQSADSPTAYDRVIQVEKDKPYSPNSQHAIKVYKDDKPIRTAIILANGGGTGAHHDCALIDDSRLIIRCCNKLFSLKLPDLNINWVTEVDLATCFSVHKYQESYISHGELTIARIGRSGEILWSFGGADIFVCLYEDNPFEMYDSYIALTDFNGKKYKIDYNGNLLDHREKRHAT